jgi:hypothetical protein
VQSKKFVKLFISLGEDIGENDNDDVSLSSVEEEEQESNDNKNNEETNNTAPTSSSQNTITIDDDTDADEPSNAGSRHSSVPTPSSTFNTSSQESTGNVDDECNQVVDLTMTPESSPARPTSTSSRRKRKSSSSQQENDEAGRYKNIAKRYKRRFQQKQSQCQEQYQNHMELLKKMLDSKKEAEEHEERCQELQQQAHYQTLELARLNLVDVRKSTELAVKTRQTNDLISAKKSTASQLAKLQANYQKDMGQARASSTAEVKELAARTRELERQNINLKDKIAQYQQDQQHQQHRVGSLPSSAGICINNISSSHNKKKKKQRDVAKALRGMDTVRLMPGSNHTKERASSSQENEGQQCNMTKYSSQAARLVAAGQKRKKSPTFLGAAAAGILANHQHPNLPPASSSSSKPKKHAVTSTSLNIGKKSHKHPLQRVPTSITQKRQTRTEPSMFQRRR